MKRRVYRVCLLWLLMVTIPVQGVAAVMLGCCSSVQKQSAVSVIDDGMLSAVDMPCNRMSMASGSAQETSSKHDKGRPCSPCPACGIGAVAPPYLLPGKLAPIKTSLQILHPPSIFVSHILPVLERPPKLLC